MFLDGPPAPCGPAGALNFNNSTRTMLHKNSKFNIIEIQTGATSTFVYGVSFIQQLACVRAIVVNIVIVSPEWLGLSV